MFSAFKLKENVASVVPTPIEYVLDDGFSLSLISIETLPSLPITAMSSKCP